MIAAGYLGSVLVSGAFLAIGAAISAMTKNQVIAFVLGVAISFVFALSAYPVVTDFLDRNLPVLAEIARGFSVIERFQTFSEGLIRLSDIVFFLSFILFWLFVNAVVVEHTKAS